ncbi:MAG: helix-turn-helix domain-containing protein [Prevotella sp.]|jgi:AraC-like DNA-binding protein
MATVNINNDIAMKKPFNYHDIIFSCFSDAERKYFNRSTEFGLNYVVSGEMLLDSGHSRTSVTRGQCVFVPRDLSLALYKQPKDDIAYCGIFIAFTREFLRDMYEKAGTEHIDRNTPRIEAGPVRLQLTAELSSLFSSLLPYLQDNVEPSDDIMQLKMQEALLALLHIDPRFYPTLFDFSEPWKIDILDYLNTHYMYEMTLDDMAHYTGRSLSAFKRDFKKVSDKTPERWLIDKRLSEAHRLIESGHDSVKSVAYTVGFKNASHFSTAFRNRFGISPAEFIRQQNEICV